jgi:UDP-N-acetylglucosamine--N-acetylmuramyl-(pentapeptide) pyrophosphoryl-undecaprenol N-acetylglucosamine transferase
MTDALVAADLVLGRAGSSTCAEVAAVGVASILVPYPFAGAHQRANAAWLADQDAALQIPDAELDASRLLMEVTMLRDDERRGAMAAAARSLARPDAAALIAAELLALAGGRAAGVTA